jgi:uroporphyrin-III C-methyltransferase
MRRGRVSLVGAGPGDPGLLTVRGRWLLRRADVVVHDRLVDRRLLDLAPSYALRIFAGKATGDHALAQEEINAVLITEARLGRRVVRLKGGDPFVFGRGGEEALALASAGIPFEVVPGVTSATAVPARAGVPVTHRGVASSFAVVTGHACQGQRAGNLGDLARAVDTLVILMGLARLPRIVREILSAGRSPSTPVALVGSGTTDDQVVVAGTLQDIVDRAARRPLAAPVTIIVGDVVALRPRIGRRRRASRRERILRPG